MPNNGTNRGGLIALVVCALLLALSAVFVTSTAATRVAADWLGQCSSARYNLAQAILADPADKAAAQTAVDVVCNDKQLDNSDTVDVDATPAAAEENHRKAATKYPQLKPFTAEQLVTWDAKDKPSKASGGPTFAIHPDLWGKNLVGLNPDEMVKEAKFRLAYSPASVASNGAMFGLWSYDPSVLDAKVKSYLSDVNTWKADVKRVSERWDEELKKGITKKEMTPGNYSAVYFYTESNVPYVRINKDVDRTSKFTVFVFSNGQMVRAACGLDQEYWANPSKGQAPAPIKNVRPVHLPPVTHNQEGTPVKTGDFCRLVNGKWQVVKGVEEKKGDLGVNDAKCHPSTPTTTTTTATNPPTPGCKSDGHGGWTCPKPSATQPGGVESPVDNPAAPTASPSPTPKATPLVPSGNASGGGSSSSSSSDGNTATQQPDQGGANNGTTQGDG